MFQPCSNTKANPFRDWAIMELGNVENKTKTMAQMMSLLLRIEAKLKCCVFRLAYENNQDDILGTDQKTDKDWPYEM